MTQGHYYVTVNLADGTDVRFSRPWMSSELFADVGLKAAIKSAAELDIRAMGRQLDEFDWSTLTFRKVN